MAITKLLRLKEGKGTNRSAHLKNNIYYICNPEKTGGGCWIGGNAGTTPDVIYKTMLMNKKYRMRVYKQPYFLSDILVLND